MTWDASGTQRIAIAAISEVGRVCVWEQTYGTLPVLAECTASGTATVTSDIEGAVNNGQPFFVFRSATGTVRRVRRNTATDYVEADLGVPTGATSVGSTFWALPTPGSTTTIDFGVRRNDGLLAVGRVTPSGTVPTWTTLSAPPGGATISSIPAAIDATRVSTSNNQVRIYARCAIGGGIDGICTFNSTTATNYASGTWMSNSSPPAGEEVFTVLTSGLDATGPRVFVSAGTFVLLAALTNLMDTAGGTTTASGWRDHVKPSTNAPDVALGELPGGTFTWANEGAVSLSRSSGVITGIERNVPPPWRVNMAVAPFAGQFWDPTQPVAVFVDDLDASQTDPVAVTDIANGMHHTMTLEVEVNSTGTDTCAAGDLANRRLVYRRASSVSQIVAMNSETAGSVGAGDPLCRRVTDGFSGSNLDHEGITLNGPVGSRTAHVVYQYGGTRVAARTVSATGTVSAEVTQGQMTLGPPVALTDAGDAVFFWSWSYPSAGAPEICEANATLASQCGTLTFGAATPFGDSSHYRFGPTPAVSRPCGGVVSDRRCVDIGQAWDIATDRNTARRFHATWQGDDGGGRPGIWYERNVGTSLTSWTTPVQVSPASSGTWFVDPNIVALDDNTLVISYVALASPSGAEAVATTRVAVSTDGGVTWQNEMISATGFMPSSLGWHCSRQRFFLGEYHDAAILGNRSEHITHRESGGRSVFRTFFATRSHFY